MPNIQLPINTVSQLPLLEYKSGNTIIKVPADKAADLLALQERDIKYKLWRRIITFVGLILLSLISLANCYLATHPSPG